jgi:hypothetical protein
MDPERWTACLDGYSNVIAIKLTETTAVRPYLASIRFKLGRTDPPQWDRGFSASQWLTQLNHAILPERSQAAI